MSKSAEHAAEHLQNALTAATVNNLVDELRNREGIEIYAVHGGNTYSIQKTDEYGPAILEQYHGPIRIITVVDP